MSNTLMIIKKESGSKYKFLYFYRNIIRYFYNIFTGIKAMPGDAIGPIRGYQVEITKISKTSIGVYVPENDLLYKTIEELKDKKYSFIYGKN